MHPEPDLDRDELFFLRNVHQRVQRGESLNEATTGKVEAIYEEKFVAAHREMLRLHGITHKTDDEIRKLKSNPR